MKVTVTEFISLVDKFIFLTIPCVRDFFNLLSYPAFCIYEQNPPKLSASTKLHAKHLMKKLNESFLQIVQQKTEKK